MRLKMDAALSLEQALEQLSAARDREMSLWGELSRRTTCSVMCDCSARRALNSSEAGVWLENQRQGVVS